MNDDLKTRPAPRVGEDVVESMALAMVKQTATHYGDAQPVNPDLRLTKMLAQAALTAAEAMGKVLADEGSVLPELPEGWSIHWLLQGNDGFSCSLRTSDSFSSRFKAAFGDGGEGPTPRAACLAAIAQVQK